MWNVKINYEALFYILFIQKKVNKQNKTKLLKNS